MGVIGYNQALERLKAGETMEWLGVPCYKYKIGQDTVMHHAVRKLLDSKKAVKSGKNTYVLAVNHKSLL